MTKIEKLIFDLEQELKRSSDSIDTVWFKFAENNNLTEDEETILQNIIDEEKNRP